MAVMLRMRNVRTAMMAAIDFGVAAQRVEQLRSGDAGDERSDQRQKDDGLIDHGLPVSPSSD